MTKIASRGGPALTFLTFKEIVFSLLCLQPRRDRPSQQASQQISDREVSEDDLINSLRRLRQINKSELQHSAEIGLG